MNMPRVHLRAGAVSVTGPRACNEDSYLLFDSSVGPGPVMARLAVADGMGGHHAGAVASRMAVDAADRCMRSGDNSSASMLHAFDLADHEIRDYSVSYHEGRSMGTTLTFAVVLRGEAVIGHVGDSRAWLLHAGELVQITADHSRVGRLMRAGVLSEKDLIGHPDANVLDQALGAGEPPSPDVYRVGLGPGDVLVLSTDGLHGAVDRDEIVDVLRAIPSMQRACDHLAAVAHQRGSSDNVTVLAWQYPAAASRTPTLPGSPLGQAGPGSVPPPAVRPQRAPRAQRDRIGAGRFRGRLLLGAAGAGLAVGYWLRLVTR